MKFIFLILTNFLLISSLFAQQHPYNGTELDKNTIIKLKPQHISQYKDLKELPFDQVIKQKFDTLPKGRANFGYTKATVWLKFDAKNPFYPDITDFLLDIGTPTLDYVELYHFSQTQNKWLIMKGGDFTPFSQKELPIRKLVFLLPFESNANTTFYVSIRAGTSIQANMQVGRERQILIQNFGIEMGYSFFYGMLGVMFFYNLFIYLILRDKSYLFYLINLAFTILFVMALVGHTGSILLPNNPLWANQLVVIMGGLLNASSLCFTYIFLDVRKYSKFLSYCMFVIIFSAMVLGFFGAILGPKAMQILVYVNFLALVSSVLNISVSVFCTIKGNPSAKYHLLSFSFYILGFAIMALRNTGVLATNPFTQYSTEWGAGIEVVLLGFALSYKYKRLKQERQAAIQQTLAIQKEANETLEQKVNQRTSELYQANNALEQMNEEINITLEQSETQKREINEKNIHIMASIAYAKRIQSAILPDQSSFSTHFQESFVLYKPKDVVSGDFYWLLEHENLVYFAVADCTGHGVPGALMSMLAKGLLDNIILDKNICQPDKILVELNDAINHALKQDITGMQDGLDCALCVWDKTSRNLKITGAHQAVLYIQNGQSECIKTSKKSIGGKTNNNVPFCLHEINNVAPDSILYLFSDGFQDQFGGDTNRKYYSKHLYTLLEKNCLLPMHQQHELINQTHIDWMEAGRQKQIDDVTLMGIRF